MFCLGGRPRHHPHMDIAGHAVALACMHYVCILDRDMKRAEAIVSLDFLYRDGPMSA